jgi:predicted transcriptional regulator YdeE
VDLPQLRLIVVRAVADDGDAIKAAWQQLEAPIASLRGRRFYGVFYETGDQQGYYAGLEPQDEAETASLGFPLLSVPAGKYVRVTIKDWPARIGEIPRFVDKLQQEFETDRARPTIEFYRSQTELHLLVPLR